MEQQHTSEATSTPAVLQGGLRNRKNIFIALCVAAILIVGALAFVVHRATLAHMRMRATMDRIPSTFS